MKPYLEMTDEELTRELEALKKASQAELEPMKKTPGE